MAITVEQRAAAKAKGFLTNKDWEHFSVRIITENGVLTAGQVKNLSETAEKFGNGLVTFTSRMTVELPGIKFDDIQAVIDYVAKDGMVTGGTGAKVRPVVACKGTVCVFGIIDTQGLAKEIHKRFFEGYSAVALPHKFKIAVGGCPNNCVKPDLNDLGIVGQLVPDYDREKCKGCKKCPIIENCPMKASSIEDGRLIIDKTICNNCGKCVGKCNFNSISRGDVGYKVYIGGRWGKSIRIGTALSHIFTREEALDIVEKAMLLFKESGIKGERFSTTVDRMGIEVVEKALLGDEILVRKADIVSK